MANELLVAADIPDSLSHESALALSIDKWERLGLKSNWEELTALFHQEKYMNSNTCGLCKVYLKMTKEDEEQLYTCKGCPLVDENKKDEIPLGCVNGSQFCKAKDSAKEKNRKEFMKARRNLLRRMRKAQLCKSVA